MREDLFILPADIRLAGMDIKPGAIRKLLGPAAGVSDYILLDLPPALNKLTAAGLVASDYVVICARPTRLDVAGLGLFMETVGSAQALNQALKVAGVFLTFVDTRSNSMSEVIKNLELPVLGSVGVSVKVAEPVGRSIIRYKLSNSRSREYVDFVAELMKVVK